MSQVSFIDAFERWYELTTEEEKRLGRKESTAAVLSWEALDHVCGLAVEAGMKALLLHARIVTADARGDFPASPEGRRPHVNELWDAFLSGAQGRAGNDWTSRLAGGRSEAPISVFQAWKPDHRYAKDGTVAKATVAERICVAKRLKKIAQEYW